MSEPNSLMVDRPGSRPLAAPPVADAPVREGATATTAAPLQPSPPARSALQRVGANIQRAYSAGRERVLESLFTRKPWERYHPRATALPPTFPARRDTPVTDDVPPALRGMVYSTAHDIHYDGDFINPGRPDTAVRFSDVMRQPNWPELIRDRLSIGQAQPGDPLRVLVPGLNTVNADTERRGHVMARDTSFAIAQLDNASSIDLNPIVLTLPGGRVITVPSRAREWLGATFQRLDLSFPPPVELLPGEPRDARGRVEFPAGSGQWLDPTEVRGLRTALNELSDANKQLIENVQRLLIAHIDRDDVSPLELWGYSEGTIVLGHAMRDLEARYLAEHMRDCPPQERDARLARYKARFSERLGRITVLCIGPAYGRFDTRVRRVDFFAAHARDSVARFAGSSRMVSAYRVLNDTVYFDQRFDAMLPYEQPFGGFDAHNFFASGGNALALYMELNGTRRVEDLCERERAGTLVRPTLAQVTERIRRNGSEAAAMEPADRLAE